MAPNKPFFKGFISHTGHHLLGKCCFLKRLKHGYKNAFWNKAETISGALCI